ncbi:hypothetical protein [Nocardiopsis lambiniae]|uniref:Ankyrin repeat domain-containing protein n=1 Tax=Nocardiopsis lambiniae TaxID=3075539 RepID=A0ABU2M688_9ACTN|nr:hypothetical protein [Nocardiopsis sp. DSM 44743]MDT0328171.1 hypothetical protein [Nocardiopsis sp. DSM 44743]
MKSSTHRPGSDSHHPERAARARRIRRYAVPRAMIERATERRLAGDWRGACAAANTDVALDLDAVRREHGAEFAASLAEDLHHLAPDLVRWHFPRYPAVDRTSVDSDVPVILSRPGRDTGPWLVVRPLRHAIVAPQRLTLALADDVHDALGARPSRVRPRPRSWTAARYLWDARHVHETRERWGGGPDRAPFLHPDGTPRAPDELPTADPGTGDPAARTEWIEGLHRAGRVTEAFAAAGIGMPEEEWTRTRRWMWTGVSPARIALEAAHLFVSGAVPGDIGLHGRVRFVPGSAPGPPSMEPLPAKPADRAPVEVPWEFPPDIDAVLSGVSPDHLHPVVREALAPARPPADGAVGPPPWEPLGPVRVRCGREWHTVVLASGGPAIPHTEEERRREAALRALGGRSTGCFAVATAWATGRGRLPKALRAHRAALFEHVLHGDAEAVLAYLDAGGDPHVRNGEGDSLLHHLTHVDHRVLLPRLLDAGLDIDDAPSPGDTPLNRAIRYDDTVPLVRALVAAGARTDRIGTGWKAPASLEALIRRNLEEERYSVPGPWEDLLREPEFPSDHRKRT